MGELWSIRRPSFARKWLLVSVAGGGCFFFWVSLSCSSERGLRKKRCRAEYKSCSGHGVGEQALLLRGGVVARRRGELHVW